MFVRKDLTYEVNPNTLDYILDDPANPLKNIATIINQKSKVLDIGAGSGILPLLLNKINKEVVIDGIEPSKYASNIASKYYRNFYCDYSENCIELIKQENYDYIIMADLIEHVSDPLDFLKNLTNCISNTTRLVISTPNVSFGAVRCALLHGEFNYVDSGLLEKTHLRFFTLKTLNEMFDILKINKEKIFYLQRPLENVEFDLSKYKIDPILYNKILDDQLASVYQFLFVLTKQSPVNIQDIESFMGEKSEKKKINVIQKIRSYINA